MRGRKNLGDRPGDLYDPAFLASLFDEMSKTYGVVNYVSSLGFCRRWRRQCVDLIDIESGDTVYDLMSGMGEVCHSVAQRVSPNGRIVAVDVSPVMCSEARSRTSRLGCPVAVEHQDALASNLPSGSADAIVACFGLKTFNNEQLSRLGREVQRLLRPGGLFSFLEISVPRNRLLRVPYMFYIGRVVPILGRIALGNPENYRMLGVYTSRFGGCKRAAEEFRRAGLEVRETSFFFGCATAISGCRPFGRE